MAEREPLEEFDLSKMTIEDLQRLQNPVLKTGILDTLRRSITDPARTKNPHMSYLAHLSHASHAEHSSSVIAGTGS